MKMTKNFVKNILIIVLACFFVLPLILMYFNLNHIEPYTGMEGSSYDTTIEGVDISGVLLSDSGSSYTGLSGEALYCIGSAIECDSDTHNKVQVGTDPLGIKLYQCKNGADICMNAIKCNGVLGNGLNDVGERSELQFKDSNGIRKIKQFNFSGNNVSDDSFLNNFTEPYRSVPLTISGEYVYLYEPNTTNIDASYSACFLYDDVQACSPVQSNEDTIKCVADYGTNVGEKVCCGQNSILQKNGRKCPKELPRCVGYKCGEKWGTCFE